MVCLSLLIKELGMSLHVCQHLFTSHYYAVLFLYITQIFVYRVFFFNLCGEFAFLTFVFVLPAERTPTDFFI